MANIAMPSPTTSPNGPMRCRHQELDPKRSDHSDDEGSEFDDGGGDEDGRRERQQQYPQQPQPVRALRALLFCSRRNNSMISRMMGWALPLFLVLTVIWEVSRIGSSGNKVNGGGSKSEDGVSEMNWREAILALEMMGRIY